MSRAAASMLREALENVGVKCTFGIPGIHRTEIYGELSQSSSITPVLVTHEGAGAFMADAVTRSGTSLGTLAIVPAAPVRESAPIRCTMQDVAAAAESLRRLITLAMRGATGAN